MCLRAGAMGLQPEGLIEGWRDGRSGSMLWNDEEPERPSRTVLLGGQATRTHRSAVRAGLTVVSLAQSRGQARRAAWASQRKVASPCLRPCSAPATNDASRARPSGTRTEQGYSLACSRCQEQSRNIVAASEQAERETHPLSRVGEGRSRERDGVREGRFSSEALRPLLTTACAHCREGLPSPRPSPTRERERRCSRLRAFHWSGEV